MYPMAVGQSGDWQAALTGSRSVSGEATSAGCFRSTAVSLGLNSGDRPCRFQAALCPQCSKTSAGVTYIGCLSCPQTLELPPSAKLQWQLELRVHLHDVIVPQCCGNVLARDLECRRLTPISRTKGGLICQTLNDMLPNYQAVCLLPLLQSRSSAVIWPGLIDKFGRVAQVGPSRGRGGSC